MSAYQASTDQLPRGYRSDPWCGGQSAPSHPSLYCSPFGEPAPPGSAAGGLPPHAPHPALAYENPYHSAAAYGGTGSGASGQHFSAVAAAAAMGAARRLGGTGVKNGGASGWGAGVGTAGLDMSGGGSSAVSSGSGGGQEMTSESFCYNLTL